MMRLREFRHVGQSSWSTVKYTVTGALVGLALAVALEAWRQVSLSGVQGEGLEGVWLNATIWGIALGLPINMLVLLLIEPLTAPATALGLDPFFVILIGIVSNWAAIGCAVGNWRKRGKNVPSDTR